MHLKIGKKYKLKTNGRKEKIIARGKVIKEYKHFYLLDCGKYKTTIMKCDITTGDYIIEEMGA